MNMLMVMISRLLLTTDPFDRIQGVVGNENLFAVGQGAGASGAVGGAAASTVGRVAAGGRGRGRGGRGN